MVVLYGASDRPKLVGTRRGFRQRHIDQAQSMNLYITNDYSMRQVLRLYLEAWRSASRPFIMSAANF